MYFIIYYTYIPISNTCELHRNTSFCHGQRIRLTMVGVFPQRNVSSHSLPNLTKYGFQEVSLLQIFRFLLNGVRNHFRHILKLL